MQRGAYDLLADSNNFSHLDILLIPQAISLGIIKYSKQQGGRYAR